VILTGPLGFFALALFALIACSPGSFLTFAARTRPVARLERETATGRYAHALAVQLGLSRAERRHLAAVAAAVAAAARRRPPTGEPLDYILATARDSRPANYLAQLLSEWWNGRGGPIGLRGEAIPLLLARSRSPIHGVVSPPAAPRSSDTRTHVHSPDGGRRSPRHLADTAQLPQSEHGRERAVLIGKSRPSARQRALKADGPHYGQH
jgi:hypothetical protein